jgi:hypothetical protein
MQMEIKIPIVIDDKALEEAIDKRVAQFKKEGDFVIVTRCKDCKWFGKIGCAIKIVDKSDEPKEDDFCSYAEPKEIEVE